MNGTLFFTANDGINGDVLWQSDGTEVGTVTVNPGGNESNLSDLTRVDDTLILSQPGNASRKAAIYPLGP